MARIIMRFAKSFAPLCMFCCLLTLTGGAQQTSRRASDLHSKSFLFDAHVHFVNRQLYLGGSIGDRLPGPISGVGIDLPNARDGGLNAMLFNLYVEPDYVRYGYEVKQTLRLLRLAREQIEQNWDVIEIALDASDIERIAGAGKIAAVLDLEGAFDKEGDLTVLRAFYDLGLRSMQIAGNSRNHSFADSSCCAARWNGINDRGRALVREMNRLGMVINLSHASEATWMQVVEESEDPVISSHQGLRAFNPDHPANASDEMLLALAKKGGVVGIHFSPNTWSPVFFKYSRNPPETARPRAPAPALPERPTINDVFRRNRMAYLGEPTTYPPEVIEPVSRFVEAIDYAVRLVGEDHVALGSDFGGGLNSRGGMTNVREYPAVTEALLAKGYSEARIRKILGGNLLRVFREITE
jgi:membrane dipeptidase